MKNRKEVDEDIGYVEQLALNLTNFIYLRHSWIDDENVVMESNPDQCEGSPADDVWELAELVSRLTGWETYEISEYDSWDNFNILPFKVGLRKPKEIT